VSKREKEQREPASGAFELRRSLGADRLGRIVAKPGTKMSLALSIE